MRTINYGPNKLVLYDDIHVLPPHRENEMHYYLLTEMGIGHTWEDIYHHMGSVRMAAAQKDDATLHQCLENMALCYLTMAGKYNPKHMAWLCLIHEYNGEVITDITEDALTELGKKISEEGGIEYMWELVFDELKKKFPFKWRHTFLAEEEQEPLVL